MLGAHVQAVLTDRAELRYLKFEVELEVEFEFNFEFEFVLD
jgi:hypothetical protein